MLFFSIYYYKFIHVSETKKNVYFRNDVFDIILNVYPLRCVKKYTRLSFKKKKI